jgi:pantoate kinase
LPEAAAFAPGHLTGLFQICDRPEDPLLKGARGSGVSLTLGTHTTVTAEASRRHSHTVAINGETMADAVVSENVLGKYLPRLTRPHCIHISHVIDTPLTAGFGSSGGGALSLSLALNQALGIGLTRVQAAQIAHVAEIECGTGLGSVFAANVGGFGVLHRPGAPGVGASMSYTGSRDLSVVYLYYGPIKTKEALGNPELRSRINQMGGGYVDELYRELTPERFMRFSRQFTEHVGLVTPRLRRVFDAMDPEGVVFTMAMFGEVAFTLQLRDDAEAVADLVRRKGLGAEPVVCGIDTRGAVLLGD